MFSTKVKLLQFDVMEVVSNHLKRNKKKKNTGQRHGSMVFDRGRFECELAVIAVCHISPERCFSFHKRIGKKIASSKILTWMNCSQ